MKKNIAAIFIVLSSMSSVASAYYNQADIVQQKQNEMLVNQCGYATGVGNSSVFGSANSYMNCDSNYPLNCMNEFRVLGSYSAEIDRITVLPSNLKNKINNIFRNGKKKQESIDFAQYRDATLLQRTKKYTDRSQRLSPISSKQFQKSKGLFSKEDNYVINKAKNDVTKLLSRYRFQRETTTCDQENNCRTITEWVTGSQAVNECRSFWSGAGKSSSQTNYWN